MNQPPTGTITFLFTDIEGSTKLWQQHPGTMPAALNRHHALLNQSIAAHGGYVFQIIGDAFCAAFSTANDGLNAALDSQLALASENWGEIGSIRVRMALHTGRADVQLGEYTSGEYISGLTLSRAARLLSAGHGGQILLSLATAELLRDLLPQGTGLRDLGARRLKDLVRPEQIFQVVSLGLPADFPPLKTLDVHPHNLPVQLASFIGRERDMIEIKKQLASTHLLTLTGIGGTGKTRLALQVSADLIDEFPGGVWLVELAPLRDPTLVEQTVASVLGVHAEPDRLLSEILVEYVREKHLLLILDNCEHLLEACAQLADLLLRNAPMMKILATSRVHLNVAGEVNVPIQPLAHPDHQRSTPPHALVQYEAVRLFIERAIAVYPKFSVTNENAPAVAQICSHLDGIPLAIELSAARTRHLSVEQISARLGDCFNLLTGGSRSALPRQQTLRAAMDWSYDLLSEAERTLFNRLSVFAGSFSLEAAEAVCGHESIVADHRYVIRPSQVLDLLGALVDHSLVSVQERMDETRYYLLETVRQYSLEKLQSSGEWLALQDSHLAYFLGFTERGAPHISVGQPVWLEQFETNYDNLRVAMEHAIDYHPESAVLMAWPLTWFTDFSNRIQESYHLAMRLLAQTEAWPAGTTRAQALQFAGYRASTIGKYQQGQTLLVDALEMARECGDNILIKNILHDLKARSCGQGDWAHMRAYAEQHLAFSRELGDKAGICDSLWALGESITQSGEIQTGRDYLEQSLKMARQENFPNIIAFSLASLAWLARLEKDNIKAIALYTECAHIRRQIWRSGLVTTLIDLVQVHLEQGDSLHARALSEESLAISIELKFIRAPVYNLAGLAGAAGIERQDQRAARLFGAVEAAVERLNIKFEEFDHRAYDPIITAVRARLAETDFKSAWAEGRQLTLEQAIELAQSG
jgi:predicted ATPase/class 3 adenylate cyclase